MSLRRACVVPCLAVAALLMTIRPADAHAELQRSDPAEGAVLATAPRHLTMTFSEAASASQSSVVLGSTRLPLTAAPGDAKVLIADLSGVASALKGTATINWRSVSSDDGHVATGMIHFRVQGATAPTVTPHARAADAEGVGSSTSPLLYAGGLGVLCLIFGSLVFAARARVRR